VVIWRAASAARPRAGRAAAALCAALFALALLPAPAGAHALLEGTTPERGARLGAAPEAVTLRFSEPVEASFGAVRVYDSRGREVQSGAPRASGEAVTVGLRGGLPDGGYTVTYRVISADSHPVSGGFVFSVGDGAAPAATVDELLAGGDSGPVTSVAFAAARAVQYGAIALAIGILAFLLWSWLPALREAGGGAPEWRDASTAFATRVRALLAGTAAAGMASAAAGIVLQGATAGGTSAWAALDPAVIGDVLATRFGLVWGLGVLAWAAAGAAALAFGARVPVLRPAAVGAAGLALPSPGRGAFAALALPVAALALLPALGGHAATQAPVALNLPANVLHVLAAGAWLGGVVVLVTALRHATARLEPADRTRLLAAAVARFSALAGVAVAVILATGVAQGLLAIDAPEQLVETAYGRAVLVKLGLLAVIVVLGWRNRARHLPALRAAGAAPGAAGVALRRTLRAELAVAVAVLGTTGALAGYPPAEAVSAGPFSTDAPLGPARLELTVEPARVGPNELHLYLFDRRDGSQYDGAKELTVEASLPGRRIAPIELDASRAGPGHYVVTAAAFGVAGDWEVEVAARVSEFDEHRATVEVPIE
jgi:copper transport protein